MILGSEFDETGVEKFPVYPTALHRVYIGRRPFSGETNFQALAPISRTACYTSDASRHLNKTVRWVKGEIA